MENMRQILSVFGIVLLAGISGGILSGHAGIRQFGQGFRTLGDGCGEGQR